MGVTRLISMATGDSIFPAPSFSVSRVTFMQHMGGNMAIPNLFEEEGETRPHMISNSWFHRGGNFFSPPPPHPFPKQRESLI